MALLALQSISATGLAPATTAAAVGGDTIQPGSLSDDRCMLQVTNGGGSPINVTIVDPGTTPLGNAGTTPPVAVAAGATKLIAIPIGSINPATGLASITYSAVTTVTVAALRR